MFVRDVTDSVFAATFHSAPEMFAYQMELPDDNDEDDYALRGADAPLADDARPLANEAGDGVGAAAAAEALDPWGAAAEAEPEAKHPNPDRAAAVVAMVGVVTSPRRCLVGVVKAVRAAKVEKAGHLLVSAVCWGKCILR